MSIEFRIIEEYQDKGIELPTRATKYSAGYDLATAEDIVLPSLIKNSFSQIDLLDDEPISLEQTLINNKNFGLKPTMIPTGVSVHLKKDQFLNVVSRSSTGSKYLIMLASNCGIIDYDYKFADNGGHIMLPLINLSPSDIFIPKGTKLCQGIIQQYGITTSDLTNKKRIGGFGSTNENN